MKTDQITPADLLTTLRTSQEDCRGLLIELGLLRLGLDPKFPQSEKVKLHLASGEALVALYKEAAQ